MHILYKRNVIKNTYITDIKQMSIYYNLIDSLKNECRIKKLKYKKIIKIINNRDHDELCFIIDVIKNQKISDIIEDIIAEREKIALRFGEIYNNLSLLNDLLIIFEEKPQASLTKAQKLFKTKIFINIYDLYAGNYEKRVTKKELRKILQKKPETRFPLKQAKEYRFSRLFLIDI